MKRAVTYLRLSVSLDDSTSIARQRVDLQDLADREGWTIVRELADDGVSGRKARTNAAEALRMIREGEAEILLVWKLDRWTRQGIAAVGDLFTTLDATPGALFVALRDGLRSDQSAWRIIAAVLAEVARTEADNTSTRAKSAIAYRKTVTHRFTGGGTIPFGYCSIPAPDGVGRVLQLDVAEATTIRQVAQELLRGDGLSAIARRLTEAGVPTSKSEFRRARYRGLPTDGLARGRWTVSTVKTLWSNDTLLGRVSLGKDVVRDDDGLPLSVWEPVLDLGTMERIRARLASRDPALAPKRRAARLLSGVAFCTHCGRRLYVTASNGRSLYACPASRNGFDCPSPKIDAERLEEFVTDRYLRILGGVLETVEVELIAPGDHVAALGEIEAALRKASAAMMADEADGSALLARIDALKRRRAELRALEAVSSRTTTERRLTGRTNRQAWPSKSMEEQRAKITEFDDHLLVSAYVPGMPKADVRSRVQFVVSDLDALSETS